MASRLFIFSILSLAIVSVSCDNSEKEKLRAENDSLRNELNSKHEMVAVMKDVKMLIDTIDASRKILRADLGEGMTTDTFSKRLQSINTYVKDTQQKLQKIEGELKSSNKKASAYLMMMDALKSELEIRVQEVTSLEAAVEEYKKENAGLVKTVKLQQTEMAEMQNKIETKQQELSLLEAKVNELVTTFKVSEADATYSRAKAVEEAANRTRLAPRKKKDTYREALELYKKSLSLGKKEAQADIDKLEKKIK